MNNSGLESAYKDYSEQLIARLSNAIAETAHTIALTACSGVQLDSVNNSVIEFSGNGLTATIIWTGTRGSKTKGGTKRKLNNPSVEPHPVKMKRRALAKNSHIHSTQESANQLSLPLTAEDQMSVSQEKLRQSLTNS